MKKYWGLLEVELEFKIDYVSTRDMVIHGRDMEGVKQVAKFGIGFTPSEGWHYIKTKDGLVQYDRDETRVIEFTPTPRYTSQQQDYIDKAVISLMAGKGDTHGVVPQEELVDKAYQIAHMMLLRRNG